MKAEEKKQIYYLLKMAKNWAYSYPAPEFSDEEPSFADDTIETPKIDIVDSKVNSSTNKSETKPISLDTENTGSAVANSSEEQENQEQTSSMVTENMGSVEVQTNSTSDNTKNSIDSLIEKIKVCHKCVLSRTRKNVVPGEGVLNPKVMVIGEGPGEDEDNTGHPFVGKAGKLLDKMLAAVELDRNCNCYIGNIVKCRPPMNRTPMPDEAAACQGFLEAQIHALKPVMILAMGRTAVQHLMQTKQGINALRGKMLEYRMGNNPSTPSIPLMATYHPSALLRDESLKRPAWEDLKLFKIKLLELEPNYAESFNATHTTAKA